MNSSRIERIVAAAGIAAAFVTSIAGFIAVVPMMLPHASHAADKDEVLTTAGKTVFQQSGCSGCHSSGIAPKLDGVGNRMSAAQLRQKLSTPGAMMPSYAALGTEKIEGASGKTRLDALVVYLQSQ